MALTTPFSVCKEFCAGSGGADGLSAYEIAVKNGFEGTEQEWLESLHGKDGDTPQKGVDYFTPKDKAELVTEVTEEITPTLNTKADKTEIPTKLSELDNDGGYVKNTDYATNDKAGLLRVAYGYGTQISSDGFLTIARCSKAEIDARINSTHPVTPDVLEYAVKSVGDGYYVKEPIVIIDTESTEYNINFLERHNHIMRCGTLHAMAFNFSNGEYPEDYGLDLSFDSGATPTTISYSASGIINWVGVDCTTSDGLSIFQPSPNTHYDIVFYYNGNQFIGLVNGYVPASGNVVSE